jgi:RND family efflux transporter MFP subunit
MPLVTIMDLERVRITVAVPESDVAWITQKTPVSITVDAWKGKAWTGTVTRYANALDPNTRTMPTEIEVDNPDQVLYPGMYAHVTFTLQTLENRLVVPRQAVLKTPTTRELLIVDQDVVKAITVSTGFEDERWVEITDGLTGAERIILQDHQRIRPGDRVMVREATS